jgi:hypothetical protein
VRQVLGRRQVRAPAQSRNLQPVRPPESYLLFHPPQAQLLMRQSRPTLSLARRLPTLIASSFELLRYLFTNAPRQIVVVDYASRLVVEYHVTGIFPAATGPAVMGDVLNFQPSHNLEKNEQAKKNQKNLAAAPRDKAPRSAPPLFQSLIVVWQCGVPLLSKRIQSRAATITKRADAVTFQTRTRYHRQPTFRLR